MALGKCLLNLTSGDTGDQIKVGNMAATSVGALIFALVFLVGFPGNIFVGWSILARARKKSVTTLIILNLAIADGSLMALTPFFVIYLVLKRWIFGNLMCKVVFYLCLSNMYASIQLIMVMSVHRLVAVVWPHHVSKILGRQKMPQVLMVVWVLVLIIIIPATIFRETRCGTRGNILCDVFYSKESHVAVHYMMELVLGFLIPYPVIIVSYICVLRRIRHTKFRRRIRSEKLILVIVVTFCICWLPYHISNLMRAMWALHPGGPMKATFNRIWIDTRPVTFTIAFVSSSVNPVLYFFAGKSYIRQEGLEFMARLFEVAGVDLVSRKRRRNSQEKDNEVEADMPEDKDLDKEDKATMLKDKDPHSHIHFSTNVVHPASTKK